MLVDIFARRYESVTLRDSFEARDSRLLVQAFRILAEDIYPYYHDGKEDSRGVAFWTNLHSRLSRELGVRELSPQWFSYKTKWNGNENTQTHKYAMVKVCENWMVQPLSGSPDVHVKERFSLIELGFRERENEINTMNSSPIELPFNNFVTSSQSNLRVPGSRTEGVKAWRAQKTAVFRQSVDELNSRLRQARYSFHYHNGFIQESTDDLIQAQLETPFWSLVSGPNWTNVDLDMKEALDLRDTDGRDPSFYAARALESTIKIISDQRNWTHGGERGANNFIENLAKKEHGFLEQWEARILKEFFKEVRNPLGHGPGKDVMPSLSRHQTEWAIEFSMSWIKSLIRRL